MESDGNYWGDSMDAIYDMGVADENVELTLKFGGTKKSSVPMLQEYIGHKQIWKRNADGWSEYDVGGSYDDMSNYHIEIS